MPDEEASHPKVEDLGNGLTRWTFSSSDREQQERDFNHWCGWFGFDEDDKPEKVEGEYLAHAEIEAIRAKSPGVLSEPGPVTPRASGAVKFRSDWSGRPPWSGRGYPGVAR